MKQTMALIRRSQNNETADIFLFKYTALALIATLWITVSASADVSSVVPQDWNRRSLTLADCVNAALSQNSAVLKSRADIEITHGVTIQTRAILLPKVRAVSEYQIYDRSSADRLSVPGYSFDFAYPDQKWSASIQLVQSVYEGGRMASAERTARLGREQALLRHRAVVADTLLAVRTAFADCLLARQQIVVQDASVQLLKKELDDTRRRFEAGTVPRFNVLRAEVELSNVRPRLIRAQNALRIAKNNLADLLGFDLSSGGVEGDMPLELSGSLEADAWNVDVSEAVRQALEKRPELAVLRKEESLRREAVINARAGKKPGVQVFAGYGGRSSGFNEDLTDTVHGWFVGGQAVWDIFDGRLTQGKISEASARFDRVRLETLEAVRKVELEVRTEWSNFVEAREVLDSQRKVQEQAEEALRLAVARSDAGSGTQLDVLGAQTSLTEARTTQIQAARDYIVARARLERAMGNDVISAENPAQR